jgi:hypothetical protein
LNINRDSNELEDVTNCTERTCSSCSQSSDDYLPGRDASTPPPGPGPHIFTTPHARSITTGSRISDCYINKLEDISGRYCAITNTLKEAAHPGVVQAAHVLQRRHKEVCLFSESEDIYILTVSPKLSKYEFLFGIRSHSLNVDSTLNLIHRESAICWP